VNENIIYFENIFTSSKTNIKSYEPVLQATTGLASIMSDRLVPEAFCCKVGSITAAQAICSALRARNKGVGGQYIRMDPVKCTLQYLWCDGFQSETFKQDIAKKKKPADWKKLYPNKKNVTTVFNSLDAARKEKTFKQSVGKANHFIFGEFRYAKFPVHYENTQVISQKKSRADNNGVNPAREAPPMMGEHTIKLLKEMQYNDDEIESLCEKNIAISTTNFLKEKKLIKAANNFKWVEYLQEGNTFGDNTKTIPKKDASSINKFNNGPLTGIKVVEICTRISGPLATQILADQGATVIKLELDKDLDPARKLGPMGNKKLGAIFANCNRNKYGMTIKCSGKMKRKGILKYIIGKKENEQLNQYFKWADVVIIDEEKEHAMSLTYERVKSINQNIIYVPIHEEKTEMVTQGLIGQCYQRIVTTINKARRSISNGDGGEDSKVNTCDNAAAYINMPINAKYVAGFVATCVTAALVARSSPNSNINEMINTKIGQKLHVSSLNIAYYMAMFDKHYNYTWLKNPFLPNFPEMCKLSDIFTCKGGEKIAMYIPITERAWESASASIINVVIDKKVTGGGDSVIGDSAMELLWHQNKDKWNKAPFDRIGSVKEVASVMRYCVSKLTFPEFQKACLDNNLSFALVKTIQDVVSSDSSYVQRISHKKLGEYATPAFGVEFTRTPCTLRKAAPLKDEDKTFVLKLVGKPPKADEVETDE
jgi:crotonobetainyl-CoA:carnitine CoA-transferase CaiB-like acyl-CoA transferase